MSSGKFKAFMKKNYPTIKDDSKEWKMMHKSFTVGAKGLSLTIDEVKEMKLGTKLFDKDSEEEAFFITLIGSRMLLLPTGGYSTPEGAISEYEIYDTDDVSSFELVDDEEN